MTDSTKNGAAGEQRSEASPSASPDLIPPSDSLGAPPVLGEYEVRREIGRGGMGTVFEAWQKSLQRMVAVKVLARQVSSSTSAVLRFQREAQAAAKLHHAHIVPIIALGEQDGLYYYAMELVDGPSLNAIICEHREQQASDTASSDLAETVDLKRASGDTPSGKDLLQAQAPVDSDSARGSRAVPRTLSGICTSDEYFENIARHVANVADALDYAHEEGVVHRDIKPHNLLLGSDGKLQISDFGLARLSEQPGVTVTGELLGSPLYMSPEQITMGPSQVDHRTDIYSLGATLYEWLALTPPYPGETREQVISQVMGSEPALPRSHNPAIPLDLETICLYAIERDRDRRYRTAGQLRDDLRNFLANRPIKARRAGPLGRLAKFVGRHQVASVATAALAVALALAGALVSKQREVETKTAVAEQAVQDAERLLDFFPVEITGPLRAAEAAVPTIEQFVQGLTPQSGENTGKGADPAAAGMPSGIAQRFAREFYRLIAPKLWPAKAFAETAAAIDMAIEYWQKDELANSVVLMQSYVLDHRGSFAARQLYVALNGRLGKYADMVEDADVLILMEPDNPNVYIWRALPLAFLGATDRSLSDLNKAISLNGNPAWVAALRGLVLAQDDRPFEAISALDQALEIDRDLVVALLGRAAARATLGNTTGAVSDLARVVALEPQNADAIACRGERYVELEDFQAAERDFQQAMDIAGETLPMYFRLMRVRSRGSAGSGGNTVKPKTAGEADPDGGPVGFLDSQSEVPLLERLSRWASPRRLVHSRGDARVAPTRFAIGLPGFGG